MSAALVRWQGERSEHLDQLATHHRSAGQGRGRRWTTDQLNRSLLIVLAAEFQGFSKDLHDEVALTIAEWSYPHDARRAQLLATAVTFGRQLNRGNASPATLGKDFGRFGINLWQEVDRRDRRSPDRRSQMEQLNLARNGIVHSDANALAKVQAPLTLATFTRWRSMANGLAATIDSVLSEYLGRAYGQPRPW